MIKYRPHRGLLANSMAEIKTFNSIDLMFSYVAEELSEYLCKEDLSISENFGKDYRIE